MFLRPGKSNIKQAAGDLCFIVTVFSGGRDGIRHAVCCGVSSFIFPEVLGAPYKKYILKFISLGAVCSIKPYAIVVLDNTVDGGYYVFVIHPVHDLQQQARRNSRIPGIGIFDKLKERKEHLHIPYMINALEYVRHDAAFVHNFFYEEWQRQ